MQPSDRPVRLTFPAFEIGAVRIMAGGVKVGHARADWLRRKWVAYLYQYAGRPRDRAYGEGDAAEELADIRAELRERVGTEGGRGRWSS